jgi:nitrous oxide reductase
MHGRSKRERSATLSRPAGSAVTWIDAGHAIVARTGKAGTVMVETIEHEAPRGELDTYLARVAHEIGDRDRVVILGPGSMRTALEREYVTIYRRPDRLLDVEPAGPVTADELVERVRDLDSGG